DDRAVVDDHVRADLDVVAEPDVLPEHQVLAAHATAPVSATGVPPWASDSPIASSTSTTVAPAQPSDGVGARSRTACTKRSHTTRSGSVPETFGMWMSPE